MKWLDRLFDKRFIEYKEEIKSLKGRNEHLENLYVEALESENNYRNRVTDAENRMLTMTTLQNIDSVEGKAKQTANQINNMFVWYWDSPDDRTKAIEKTIENVLIEQIKGTSAWTENTDKYKGTVA